MKPKFLSVTGMLAALLLFCGQAGAQNKVAVKTNLLYDATLTPNLGVEWGFAPQWSAQLSGSYHGTEEWWRLGGEIRLGHWLVQPQVKYWFCEKFAGAFVGINGIFGRVMAVGSFPLDFSQINPQYGVNLRSYLMEDCPTYGVGLSAGYDFVLGRHWNLELELGVGYVDAIGNDFEMEKDANGHYFLSEGAEPYYTGHHDYFGPTKLAVSIVYLF